MEEGAPRTLASWRETYLADGLAVVSHAVTRLTETIPSVQAFLFLWFDKPANKAKIKDLRDLYDQYVTDINGAADQPAMQTAFDALALAVAAVVNPAPAQPVPDPAVVPVEPVDAFDLYSKQELLDAVIKYVYFGNESLRATLAGDSAEELRKVLRDAGLTA